MSSLTLATWNLTKAITRRAAAPASKLADKIDALAERLDNPKPAPKPTPKKTATKKKTVTKKKT